MNQEVEAFSTPEDVPEGTPVRLALMANRLNSALR